MLKYIAPKTESIKVSDMKLFRKHFRIIREERVTGILPYRIQERYTIFFFIHWWSTPTFAPPHLFDSYWDAYDYIKMECPNAIIESDVPYC